MRWLVVVVAVASLWGFLGGEADPWKRATVHGFGMGTTEAQVCQRLGKPDSRDTGYNFLRLSYPGFSYGYGCQIGQFVAGDSVTLDGRTLRADGRLRARDVAAVFGRVEVREGRLMMYEDASRYGTGPTFTVLLDDNDPDRGNPIVTGFDLSGW